MSKNDSNKNTTFENICCDNCGTCTFDVFFDQIWYWQHPGRFRLVKCKKCQLVYLNPRPVLNDIGKYYQAESYWGQDITQARLSRDWKEQRLQGYDFLYKKIAHYHGSGSILDIGAGTGLFLSWFNERSWHVDGIELSKDAVKYARTFFKLSLSIGDFLNKKYKKNFYHVVTLNNVLEHLHDPLKTLEKVYSVTKINGVVLITVPNIDSWGIKIFGKKSHLLQPPRHLYQFSETTLGEMVQRAGFEVIETDYGYWEHIYYSIFESFKLTFSKKFGELKREKKEKSENHITKNNSQNILKESSITVIKIISYILAKLEIFLKKSEVITLVAIKRN